MVVVAAMLVGGWLAVRDEEVRARDSLVDDRIGAYGGVQMGDTAQKVRRVFGEPSTAPGFSPAGKLPAEVGGPEWIPGPGRLFKYEDVGFLLNGRVYAFIVAANGAETTRGVAIGDRMDEARKAYRLQCTRVAGGEGLFGVGGQEFYPSCGTRLGGGLRIWFGRDPIASITLLRRQE